MDPQTRNLALSCLSKMRKGLERNAGLIAVALPRTSSELLVVAACAQGLLDDPPEGLACVLQEKGKRDLVVELRDAQQLHFEFKMLWHGGKKENLRGLRKDVAKLEKGGVLVAVAFELEKCPPGIERFKDKGPGSNLEGLIHECDEELKTKGAIPLPLDLPPLELRQYDVVGKVLLAAWLVDKGGA